MTHRKPSQKRRKTGEVEEKKKRKENEEGEKGGKGKRGVGKRGKGEIRKARICILSRVSLCGCHFFFFFDLQSWLANVLITSGLRATVSHVAHLCKDHKETLS